MQFPFFQNCVIKVCFSHYEEILVFHFWYSKLRTSKTDKFLTSFINFYLFIVLLLRLEIRLSPSAEISLKWHFNDDDNNNNKKQILFPSYQLLQ